MTASDLTPTVTSPDFGRDPLGYYIWHLNTHGELYQAFRGLADTYRLRNPQRPVSADMICHVLRFNSTLGADDDTFRVNNVITPLYARLYLIERPQARISVRNSWLDTLNEIERELLYSAFYPLREVTP